MQDEIKGQFYAYRENDKWYVRFEGMDWLIKDLETEWRENGITFSNSGFTSSYGRICNRHFTLTRKLTKKEMKKYVQSRHIKP